MERNLVLGIDPGAKSGALCVMTTDGSVIDVMDAPTRDIIINGKDKIEIDIYKLHELIHPILEKTKLLVIEKVHSMPGEGVSSAFRFGESLGILKGLTMPYVPNLCLVPPQTWKKAMLTKGLTKREVVEHVRDTYKDIIIQSEITLVKHHNKAEAFLIAKYGLQHWKSNNKKPLWEKHTIN